MGKINENHRNIWEDIGISTINGGFNAETIYNMWMNCNVLSVPSLEWWLIYRESSPKGLISAIFRLVNDDNSARYHFVQFLPLFNLTMFFCCWRLFVVWCFNPHASNLFLLLYCDILWCNCLIVGFHLVIRDISCLILLKLIDVYIIFTINRIMNYREDNMSKIIYVL